MNRTDSVAESPEGAEGAEAASERPQSAELLWERRLIMIIGIGFLSAGTALAFRGQEGTATVIVLLAATALIGWGLGIRPPRLKVGGKDIDFW